ncbi:MAG: hypothetical protein J5792_00500 [Bacteroidales bacterium]|nr:hypothetical protein [Bacteroidales bacterium]
MKSCRGNRAAWRWLTFSCHVPLFFFCLFPLLLHAQQDTTVKIFKHKDLNQIEPKLYDYKRHLLDPQAEAELFAPFVSDETLRTSGSLTRGITVGSNRDLSMDASLNLQLSGMLSEDLSITAFISDENLPLQASSAYSLQGKDFDRIYIRLDYKDRASLLAGDVDLSDFETYFLRFHKQGKGGKGEFRWRDTVRKMDYAVTAAAAVAKGSFCRQQLKIIDGVQGAYRLQGADEEQQIIVLSASERVYVDGVLVERGENADYTIDYNLAEITFTVRQPMTADKRVVVEFEYSDQHYVRMLTHLQSAITRRHWQWNFAFYNEQDLKRQSNQLELDSATVAFLRRMGNAGSSGYYPMADSIGFLSEEVLYKRIDSVVSGQRYDSVYVYSTNKDSACYRLRFSYMGEGKGNYVRLQSGVNGQVYAWVAPVNGVPQGSYEPVVPLFAPKRLQQYTTRLQFRDSNRLFRVEAALSNNDPNTFASNDSSVVGAALRAQWQRRFCWGKGVRPWSLLPDLYGEWKGAGFMPVESYRDVEFVRNYNLADSLTANRSEFFMQAGWQMCSPWMDRLSWQSVLYRIPRSEWEAFRHRLQWNSHHAVWESRADIRLLQSQTAEYNTRFWQADGQIALNVWKMRMELWDGMEWNTYRSSTGSLMPESQSYNEWKLSMRQRDTNAGQWQYRLAYAQRKQWVAGEQQLQAGGFSRHLQADLDCRRWREHPLQFSLVYRSMEAKDSAWMTLPQENTLLGSLRYSGKWAKGAVQTNFYYHTGTAMEEKVAYTYLKVADGQGVYQWNDYNGNGVEELDEFEPALYRDKANYIRIYQVSQEYVRVYANSCTYSLILRPAAVWQQRHGWRRTLSRFSYTGTFQSQLKKDRDLVRNSDAPLWQILNPYHTQLEDSLLNTANLQWRNLLTFNQSHPVFGAEGIFSRNMNKYLTVNGFEYNASTICQGSVRYRICKILQTKWMYKYSQTEAHSRYMSSKNYWLDASEVSCQWQFPYRLHFSFGGSYTYKDQNNTIGEERAFTHQLMAEMTCRIPQRGSLSLQCRYHHILFHGEENSSVAYQMMEALSNGSNAVFNVICQLKLGEFLQMDLNYECRIGEHLTPQQLGGIAFRALL